MHAACRPPSGRGPPKFLLPEKSKRRTIVLPSREYRSRTCPIASTQGIPNTVPEGSEGREDRPSIMALNLTHRSAETLAFSRREFAMRFSTLLCAFGCVGATVLLSSSIQAQSPTATFQCPAQPADTCFFYAFGPNFTGTPFELRGGETKQIPGVVIGRDTYCYGVNQPPASTCQKRPVSEGINR